MKEPQARKSETSDGPDAAVLREYLSNRDATCPECGYNLRDAAGDTCPECGDALVLMVAARGGFRPRYAVLALLLFWLLVAGAMNTTRAIRDVQRRTATAQIIQQVMTTLAPVTPPPQLSPSATARGTAPAIIAPAGPVTIQTDGSATTITAPTIRVIAPQTAGATTVRLGAVPWHRWVNVGWWSILTLAAAFGLVLLVVTRRRPASRRVTRTLVTITSLGFAGFLAYHLYHFAIEVF